MYLEKVGRNFSLKKMLEELLNWRKVSGHFLRKMFYTDQGGPRARFRQDAIQRQPWAKACQLH